MTDSSDADLLSIFWVEVREYLEALNSGLLQVEMLAEEDAAARKSALQEMNRIAHSMKGAARAVGIQLIETVAHYMEEIFGAAQKGRLRLEPALADVLYDGLDLIQRVVAGEENDEATVAAVLNAMQRIIANSDAAPSHQPPAPPAAQTAAAEQTTPIVIRPVEETIRVAVSKLDRLMAQAGELLIARMHGEDHAHYIRQLRRRLNRWGQEWRAVRAAYIRLARQLQERQDGLTADWAALFKFLELNQRHLMELSRQLGHFNQRLAQDNMQLSVLADQLQNDIGAMRMMPFETIVGGFQRMVRDLARELHKQIQLDISGGQIEVDKAVLDALKDPLMHIIRNALDHGIELPADRERVGKPPVGRIHLWVEQRGGELTIGVEDDGRGIDEEALRRRIVALNLLTEEQAQALSSEEVRSYIFHSGLTTSQQVTHLSGRGIGMDIVRDRVESLRGRIEVRSQAGRGTTMLISVPISLTRLRCILLSVGEERYAIPSALVVRMEKIAAHQLFTVEGRPFVEIHQRRMPLASLAAVLQTPQPSPPRDDMTLVVLSSAERFVAFEVDALLSEMELVLKPVGEEIINLPFISGAALLSSGELVIVLDVHDLVRAATGATLPRRERLQPAVAARQRPLRVLIVDDSITTRTLEKNILETAGFDVRVAIDGQEAWAMINEIDFDLIISDIEMPNMDGLTLTKLVKETLTTQHIPVILLTSLAKPEQREAGLRVGADAYLVKSQFDQDELLRTIQAVI